MDNLDFDPVDLMPRRHFAIRLHPFAPGIMRFYSWIFEEGKYTRVCFWDYSLTMLSESRRRAMLDGYLEYHQADFAALDDALLEAACEDPELWCRLVAKY